MFKSKMLSALLIVASFGASFAALAAQKVAMLIPDDFMWPEYKIPRDLYEQAGFEVTTVGKYSGEVKPDRRNAKDFPESKTIKLDLTFEQLDVSKYDAITFVAGNGAWHDFFPTESVHKIVSSAMSQNKVLGLLCASTGLLGLVGNFDGNSKPIAEGKRVVGYFRVEGILRKLGKVNFIPGGNRDPGVEVDGNLVTGRNPESSKIFGEKIVEVLVDRQPGSLKTPFEPPNSDPH